MDDDERATIGREHRQRASSEPVADAFAEEDHFTPVAEVVKRIEEAAGRLLTEDELRVAHETHRIAADRHMRVRQQHVTSEQPYRGGAGMTAEEAKRLDAVEDLLVEKFGRGGKNGDVGALRASVEKAEARRWWLLTFLAGLLVTVVGSAVAFGSWMGSIEADVETLKARALRRNGSTPDYPAARETP
jgi:hypothetical protein